MACRNRPLAPKDGESCAQALPSHAHVSLLAAAAELPPPTTSVRPADSSKAVEWPHLADGPELEASDQTRPSHSKVVPTLPAGVPSRVPPKRTARLRALSYAKVAYSRGPGPSPVAVIGR